MFQLDGNGNSNLERKKKKSFFTLLNYVFIHRVLMSIYQVKLVALRQPTVSTQQVTGCRQSASMKTAH